MTNTVDALVGRSWFGPATTPESARDIDRASAEEFVSRHRGATFALTMSDGTRWECRYRAERGGPRWACVRGGRP